MPALNRYVTAQAAVYDGAVREIRAGRKTGHWMWFIFPQIAGLGRSAMTQTYAITSLIEARAYLAHPLLGPRLRACVAAIPDRPATEVFGTVDAMKLRSSLTLFAMAGDPDEPFGAAIDRLFGGVRDEATLQRIGVA
ncbi:MAG TPA: DUF1810 domain-containing protein [Sphingomonas sp.]|jgi:uncharacterized protein (DUF1810 family)|uniref:DUF1810 domain-containing protein n=1 Tax=Sphingomonas sp. TaxID=28214 RepID=UPI002ED97658